MIILQNMKSLSLFLLFLYCYCLVTIFGSEIETTTPEATTTPEPEASVGCPPPDLKLSRPRKYGNVGGIITTEIPYVTFETTQIYLPEDFTTADFEFIENIEHAAERASHIENIHRPYSSDINSYDENDEEDIDGDMDQINRRSRYTDFNPYSREDSEDTTPVASATHGNNKANRKNTRRHSTRRRTFDSHHRTSKREIHTFDQDIHEIYMQSADLTSNLLDTIKQHDDEHDEHDELNDGKSEISSKITNNFNENKFNLSYANKDIRNGSVANVNKENLSKENLFNLQPNDDQALNNGDTENKEEHNRVKRKSGKTTGALSRPKADSGSSSAKSTSRKTQAGVDEDSGGFPLSPDEFDSKETDEEHKEPHDHSQFSEVSEVRFPGEVGPLGERRLCKIKCIKGKWIGPLCASQDDTVADGTGLGKFQPLYKNCRVTRIPPHLLLSYKNVSVTVGWDLPHGHSLQARCKDLGMYKLLGESRVLCSNGLWAPRMPSCVPTTLLTNYSDDSPPSIRIKIGIGSGAFEPSGVLAVLPGSTLHLDCMYPRRRGTPEWTWTGWFRQYITGWSTLPEEKATRYRLTIKDIQNQDSGTFTCASPRGLTNSVVIIVAISQCPNMPEAKHPLSLRLEGNKLGQKALYRCPLGYIIKGTANATCLASGNWSSPPPTCHPVQCPPLQLEDAHLSLVELNASAWGRAVFRCSWGYRLTGPPGLECEPTGVWSGPIPRCRAIQCPQPLVPINGRIDGTSGSSSISHRRYAVGALVTFSCTEGHLLVGEASIVCTETGFWSHPPPFCKAQCPYPGDPSNGLIAPLKFHYDPGDYLSVQCRPGFVEYGLNGPPERPRCLPDGNWSGPVPQCRNYEEV